MVPHIGTKTIYKGDLYHVQDRDCLAKTALIAFPDKNDLCWDAVWVSWNDLRETDNNELKRT